LEGEKVFELGVERDLVCVVVQGEVNHADVGLVEAESHADVDLVEVESQADGDSVAKIVDLVEKDLCGVLGAVRGQDGAFSEGRGCTGVVFVAGRVLADAVGSFVHVACVEGMANAAVLVDSDDKPFEDLLVSVLKLEIFA